MFFPVNPMELLSVDKYSSIFVGSVEGPFEWMSLQRAKNKKYSFKITSDSR